MLDDSLLDARTAWRREPSISSERVQELQARLKVATDVHNGVFPFAEMTLTRADVEWLLINHEHGRGPVNWDDPTQRERRGIDLRGARLAGEDLSDLPLSKLLGGLTTEERIVASKSVRDKELRDAAAIHLEGANLARTHLEGATLRAAHLEGACLFRTRLDGAILAVAHFEGSDCRAAHFEGAGMDGVHLEGFTADNPPTSKRWIADFSGPVGETKQVAFLTPLPATSLRLAYFDAATQFKPASIGNKRTGYISIVDARLKELNLTRVDWSTVSMLGDERLAYSDFTLWGTRRTLTSRIAGLKIAARASSQLAIVLSEQGMADQGTNFQYRALILQRKVMWFRIRTGKMKFIIPFLLSWLLFILTGYGYRMWRLLLTYILVVVAFAAGYVFTSQTCTIMLPPDHSGILACNPKSSWINYILISVMALHGRVFSQQFVLGSAQSILTAIEAIVGLVIEGIFIAMLTQRVFNR